MKVLFLISSVGIGGHTRSAIAIGRALTARGVGVHMAAGDGKGIEIVEKSGLPFTVLPTTANHANMVDGRTRSAFESLAAKQEPDVIHAFDLAALTLGFSFARRKEKKLVYTICGGPVPNTRIPVMRPIVVFSRELFEGLQRRYGIPADHLHLNGARINLKQDVFPPDRLAAFRQQVGLPADCKIVMTISRIARSKLPPLFNFIEAADRMGGESGAVFLIVGASDDPVSLQRLGSAIDQVNARHKRKFLFWTDHESAQAAKLLPIASVAIGLARTAFEAMNLGIPTLIVGPHGFAGIADRATCDILSEANFSGRNALMREASDRSPVATASAIKRLIREPDYHRQVAEEGRHWIRENLDVNRGAEFYEGLYRDSLSFRLPKPSDILLLQTRAHLLRLYQEIVPEGIKRRVTDARRGTVELSTQESEASWQA